MQTTPVILDGDWIVTQIYIPYKPPAKKTRENITQKTKDKFQQQTIPIVSAIKFNVGGNPALKAKETATSPIIEKDIKGNILTYEIIRVLNIPPRLVATLNNTGLARPWPTNIERTAAWQKTEPWANIGKHTPICIILLKAIIAFKSDCFVPE